MKNLWMDRCLFENPYHLTLCTTVKQYERELKRMRIAKSERPKFTTACAACHFFSCDVGRIAIVCIRKDKTKDKHQHNALLVHEAVHVWQEVKNAIGEKSPSPEFEAYAIQSIAQCLMTEFERQSK